MEKMEMHGEIWIDKVKPDPNNPRKTFDKEADNELMEGIKLHGQINAIEIDENNTIIDGERRWKMMKKAGMTKIKFTRKMMGEKEKKEPGYRLKEQLQANLTGRTLGIDDSREAIEQLLAASNSHFARGGKETRTPDEATLTKLAPEIGVSRQYLGKILKISREAAPEVKQAVDKKVIPFSTAVEIASVPNKEVQKDFLDYADAEKLSRDEVREVAKKLKDKTPKQAKEEIEQHRIMSPELEKSAEKFAKGIDELAKSGVYDQKPDAGFNNFISLIGVQAQLEHNDIFCPNCKKPKTLVWGCCHKSVAETVEELRKKYEKKR